jgi:hypothetical protein
MYIFDVIYKLAVILNSFREQKFPNIWN